MTSLAYGIYTTATDVFGDFSSFFCYDIGPENFAIGRLPDYSGWILQSSYIFPENVFLLMQNIKISGYASGEVYAKVYIGTGEIRWQGNIKVLSVWLV